MKHPKIVGHRIVFPSPITKPGDDGPGYSAVEFYRECLDAFSPLGKGPQNRAMHAKIDALLRDAEGSEGVAIETALFRILASAVAQVSCPPAMGRLVVPFDEAVQNAQPLFENPDKVKEQDHGDKSTGADHRAGAPDPAPPAPGTGGPDAQVGRA